MRAAALLLMVALPAHADLYRWIDPGSGSVKLSTQPPSDPSVSAEVVPFRNPAALVPQAAAAPAKPAAGPIAALEARMAEILAQFTGAGSQDLSRAGQGLREHAEAYEAVRVELDRLDPAGAARRRNEATGLIDRMRQGFAAQFGTAPPAQK